MTRLRYILASVAFIPLLWLGGCVQLREDNNGARNSSGTPFEYSYDKVHALPSGAIVHVVSEDADVSVLGSDRKDVLVQVSYRIAAEPETLRAFEYRIEVREQQGELQVTEFRRPGTRNFVYRKEVHKIVVEIPRSASLVIEEEDGNCRVAGVSGSVAVRMDDGRVRFEDCRGEMSLTHDNGSFEAENCSQSVKLYRR